jgi:hypothetical protein
MAKETDASERDASETDYLAYHPRGYGYGYTAEQALAALAEHVGADGTVTVKVIEHVGDASTGPMGWEVEEFVSGETLEIPADEWAELSTAAMNASHAATAAVEAAEAEDIETA